MPRWLNIEGIPPLPARFYARFAARCSIMQGIYREVAEEVAAAVRAGTVLDVGTGPGYLPLALAPRGSCRPCPFRRRRRGGAALHQ